MSQLGPFALAGCERNYDVSVYVAEFWNSLSSLAMCAVGLVGVLLHRRSLEARYLLAFALVACVGVPACSKAVLHPADNAGFRRRKTFAAKRQE